MRSRLIKHLLLLHLAKLISALDLGLLLFVLLLKLLVTPVSDNNKIKDSESCYLRLICSNSLRFLLPLLLEVQGADLDDLLNSISLLLLLLLLELLLLELAKRGECRSWASLNKYILRSVQKRPTMSFANERNSFI